MEIYRLGCFWRDCLYNGVGRGESYAILLLLSLSFATYEKSKKKARKKKEKKRKRKETRRGIEIGVWLSRRAQNVTNHLIN